MTETAINAILQMGERKEIPTHLLNYIFQDTLRDYTIDLFDPTFTGMGESGFSWTFKQGDCFYLDGERLILKDGILTHSNIKDCKAYLRMR